MRTTIAVALTTLALAAALLVSGGRAIPGSADRPAHPAPARFSSPFAGLSPARDVWGQYDQSP